MKILLIAPEYPPYIIGGGGNIYPNLAKNYLKQGHELSIIYGYFPSKSLFEKTRSYKKDQISFHQLPELPIPNSTPYLKIRMPLNLQSLSSIQRIIRKERPDVAHLHGYGFASIDILAYFLKKTDIPYLLTIHGWPVAQEHKNPLLKFLVNNYLLYISSKTLKNASAITTVSKFLETKLPKHFQSKSSVIYNPFQPKIKLSKQKSSKPEIKILSLGRISKDKGFQEIINLIPSLLKAGFKVNYSIAGLDEGYHKNLEAFISDLKLKQNITFLGQVDEKTKWKLIDKADFIAVPSFIEGFGLVVLEAISRNKIILYGKSEAVQEILGEYPYKISIYDKNFLELIKTKKISSKKFDFSPFDEKNIAKQYLNLLGRIRK